MHAVASLVCTYSLLNGIMGTIHLAGGQQGLVLLECLQREHM